MSPLEQALGDVPAAARNVIALDAEACTSCMLCARECPDWCIEIDSHKETVQAEGQRPRVVHVLDRFAIDFGLCMWCGICIEVCPFDALFWSADLPPSVPLADQLVHERDLLGRWLAGTPSPR